MTLPARRLLNLMYHYLVRGLTPESRATIDDVMAGTPIDAPAPAAASGRHVPGTAPTNIPAPSWWRGNRAAFSSSVAAGQQLGEPAALKERRRAPQIGTAAMAGVM